MSINASTLRPGLLVAVKTSIIGNVSYAKRDLERDHLVGAARVAKWETKRTVSDAEEHDEAVRVRSNATYAIRKLCAATAFGFLCPEDKADELAQAIEEARGMADAFNATARITRVRVYAIAGRVAPDDVEAVRAIRAELAATIGDMEKGVASLTPETIREAARRAAQLSEMLTDTSKKKVQASVEAARATASAIAKAVKAGEQAATAVDKAVAKKLAACRTAFLDLDNDDVEISNPKVAPRALDLETGV